MLFHLILLGFKPPREGQCAKKRIKTVPESRLLAADWVKLVNTVNRKRSGATDSHGVVSRPNGQYRCEHAIDIATSKLPHAVIHSGLTSRVKTETIAEPQAISNVFNPSNNSNSSLPYTASALAKEPPLTPFTPFCLNSLSPFGNSSLAFTSATSKRTLFLPP